MRFPMTACLLTGTLAASTAAFAAPTREEVAEIGISAGKTYQVAQHCGARDNALDAYKKRFDTRARAHEALAAQVDVDLQKFFLQGRLDGDLAYDEIKARPPAERDAACGQALKQIATKARG